MKIGTTMHDVMLKVTSVEWMGGSLRFGGSPIKPEDLNRHLPATATDDEPIEVWASVRIRTSLSSLPDLVIGPHKITSGGERE